MRIRLIGMLTLILLGASVAGAQSPFPEVITYQGIITDSAGIPITDSGVSVRYTMYDTEAGGAFFWGEVTQVDVTDGRVTHLMGSLTPFPDSMFTAFDSLWLEILVQGEAMVPRILITPSAYSMRVKTVDQATGGDVYGDLHLHSTLTVGDAVGSQGGVLVYDGFQPTIIMKSSEGGLETSDITMRRSNGDRTVEIDADETDVSHIRLYHSRSGGGEVKTIDIAASGDGATGGQILVLPVENSANQIELTTEYAGPASQARIGVNARPDSGTVHVVSDQKVAGYFTSTNSGSGVLPRVLYAKYEGSTTGNVVGTWSEAHPQDGDGTGGIFIGGEDGVVATAKGGDANFGCIGVLAQAEGTGGIGTRYGVLADADGGETNYGIFASASGGTNNWAAWLSGSSHATKLAVGTTNLPTGYDLTVGGKMLCEEVEVLLEVDWPDYVFEEDYDLMPLEKLEQSIAEAGHLPDVPSAAEVAREGVAVGEMQATLLRKIEELSLHMIALNKDMQRIQAENARLRDLIERSGEEN